MKKVLLFRPNHTEDKTDHYISFPSGLAYVAAALREEGHVVKVMDLTLEDVDYENVLSRIRDFGPDLIGMSALSHAYPAIKRAAALLKREMELPIILGGHLSTQSYAIVLRHTDVDICVLGEGELTMVDLLNNLDSLERVKGIAFLKDGELVKTLDRELIQDLDSLPMPAYDLFEMDKYSRMMKNVYMSQKNLPKGLEYRKIAMETGRGCPFGCQYCSKMYRSIRKRSVDNIINEIRYLHEEYKINIFRFQDELFFFDKEYVQEFCTKISELNVGWSGNARIDTVDEEMVKLIRANNCISISFGVESGSDRILKNMHKGITRAQIEKTLNTCLKQRLPISINLILGYPGENYESVEETVDMLRTVGYPGTKFHYITPYPGSPLYDKCVAEGLIVDEERYLESLGDGTGPYQFRFNFTELSDDELTELLPKTAKRVLRNYIIHLLLHPRKLFRYLMHKDIMNPAYLLYNKIMHPTNYDKAASRKK